MTPDPTSSPLAYSPPIEITLEIFDERVPVAQVGPEFLILRTPRDFAPTLATVVVTVDGQPVRRRVRFPSGIRSDLRRQPLILLEEQTTLAEAG